jgi:ornithine carbamoyltransferase
MDLIAQPAHPSAEKAFPAAELGAVLARALVLARAAKEGPPVPALRGKNIGLVGAAPGRADTELLQRAATELGAKVAHVRPGWTAMSSATEVADTARLLGRLYDAIDISGSPAELVRQVRHAAGVPVFDSLGSPEHPTAQLAGNVADEAAAPDAWRYVVQAVLLTAMAG